MGLRQLREARQKKYRNACRALAVAAILAGLGNGITFITGHGQYMSVDLFSFPITLISSSQALLFTYLLTLLFRSEALSRRWLWLNAAPSLFFILLYSVSLFIWEDKPIYDFATWQQSWSNPPQLIRAFYAVAYLVQLVIYTRFFMQQRHIYLDLIRREFADELPQLELRWVTQGFFLALLIGILASAVSFWPTPTTDALFTTLFTVFYIFIAFRYINYHYTYELLEISLAHSNSSALTTNPQLYTFGEESANKVISAQDALFSNAQRYMQKERPYLNPGYGRLDLARDLGSNETYLAMAVKTAIGITTKEYIDSYRVERAVSELLTPVDRRSMEEIALASGFSNTHTFTRIFQKNMSLTPGRFRKEMQ